VKITLSRDQLMDAVSWAALALPARPASPLLASLRLHGASGLSVSAFGYEVSAEVSVPADVASKGAALVPGRLLADIVRSLPARPAELTTDLTRMTLRCGPSVFTLPLVPAEAYPGLPDLPPLAGAVGSAAFATAVSQVAVAASRNDTLPVLTGVQVEIKDGTLTLAATDRYRLAIKDLPWTPAQPDPRISAVLIPARLLHDAARSLTGAAETRIYLAGPSGGIVGFGTTDRHITARLISEEYPQFRSLIPAESSTTAEIPVGPFTEAIGRVALVAEGNAPVRLSLTKDRVTIEAGAGGEAQATEDVDISGIEGDPEIQAAFNPAYLLDGLGALGTDTASISFAGPAKPAVLTGKARAPMRGSHRLGPEADYRYVLMPIRPGERAQEEQ
jgi:DNA polymerase-3 subunit beta